MLAFQWLRSTALVLGLGLLGSAAATAQEKPPETPPPGAPNKPETPPDYPPADKVLEGFTKVVSPDGKPTLYTIWTRAKDNQMFAELPRDFANQKYFIALTVAAGDLYAGLQLDDMYVYWRQYNKRLALVQPNVEVRSTGDQESKDSVKRLFTDRVVVDAPIVAMGQGGGPIIDMDELLVGKAPVFFGRSAAGINPALGAIKTAKAFPFNVELAFEAPVGGQLRTFHYSISLIKDNPAYKPRLADQRVGYFTTAYNDLGKFKEPETWVRYINRWHLEKADPSLKLSPPKEPITFYIEHTTPIRYRRWVKQGVEYWNKAFEQIGLSDAIKVEYQDSRTGAHMEKDPEDVRWNFIRWLNNDMGTAIGPSRVHPLTGQILDADIILTDGWIRAYWKDFNYLLPEMAMEGFTPETLGWLAERPQWDPRVRMADPAYRREILRRQTLEAAKPFGGHAMANVETNMLGDDEYDGLVGRSSQVNGFCNAAAMRAFDVATFRMMHDLAFDDAPDKDEGSADDKDKEKDKEKKKEAPKEEMIDGVPESFIGPLLADLVAHEVGHTLGLRHNFKASAIYPMAKINSEEIKGKAPFAGSVMDYLPVNINMDSGEVQGDWAMISIGPYDMWAIEYGYTFADDLKPILARVAEPELQYGTDEDTGGPDPLARRYDFAADPIAYAKSQYRLAQHHRGRILDKFVKDGESWAKARRGYEMTLAIQLRSLSMMGNWLGGAFIHRDKKGDKDARTPIQVVPTEQQREALSWVLEHAFRDEIWGLSPDLLNHMTVDKWLDGGGFRDAFTEPTWPIHDRIVGFQSAVLTMLMNPTTLRRVYDNEFRLPADQDALTLAEMMTAISNSVWTELNVSPEAAYTARSPLVSSLRRNLQQEHLDRLVDLALPQSGGTAEKAISNLAMMQIREIRDRIASALGSEPQRLDPYSRSHLEDAVTRITKLLDSQMIYNAKDIGGRGGGAVIFLGRPDGDPDNCRCARCQLARSPATPFSAPGAPSAP